MTFTKQLVTENDKKEFKEKFGVTLSVGDAFVVNTERDCLLHSPRQDRRDMGGTPYTYWYFTYRNRNFRVACDIGETRDEKKVYYTPIVSIKDDGIEIKTIDKGFIENFSQAYHIYDKYRDLEPERESASTDNKYKFQFKGEIK